MDGQALELEDTTFDISGSQFGVMLFPDMPRGIRELARVTKLGGRAAPHRGRDRPGRRRAVRAGSMWRSGASPTTPRTDTPVFDFGSAPPRPGRVKGRSDYDLFVERGLDAAADADLVCLAPQPRLPRPRPRRSRRRPRRPTTAARSLRALLGRVRARRGRAARRAASAPRTGATPAIARGVPRGQGAARRPLRPGRQHPHRRRLGGRHRRGAAPDARAVRRPGGRQRRPPDGGAAAPRRRPGPVHRAAGARLRRRDLRAAAQLDPREPRRRPRPSTTLARAVADVAAHVRPPLPGRDRGHPARLVDRQRVRRAEELLEARPTAGGAGSPPRSGSAPPPRCATTSPGSRGVSPQQYRRAFSPGVA